MTRVSLIGWRYGLKSVPTIRLIREFTQLGLHDAKDVVDRLLEGKINILEFETDEEAQVFLNRAEALGVIGKLNFT